MKPSRVFVDTSIWIEFFRGKNTQIIRTLSEQIDHDQVVISKITQLEILNGAKHSEFKKLQRVLDALGPRLPDSAVWNQVENWIYTATKKGIRFGIADLIIAAQAKELKIPVWSLDSDFKRMKSAGFTDLFEP